MTSGSLDTSNQFWIRVSNGSFGGTGGRFVMVLFRGLDCTRGLRRRFGSLVSGVDLRVLLDEPSDDVDRLERLDDRVDDLDFGGFGITQPHICQSCLIFVLDPSLRFGVQWMLGPTVNSVPVVDDDSLQGRRDSCLVPCLKQRWFR